MTQLRHIAVLRVVRICVDHDGDQVRWGHELMPKSNMRVCWKVALVRHRLAPLFVTRIQHHKAQARRVDIGQLGANQRL